MQAVMRGRLFELAWLVVVLSVGIVGCGDSDGGTAGAGGSGVGGGGGINGGPGTVTATINGVTYASNGIDTGAELEINDDFVEFALRIDAEQEQDGFDEDLDVNFFGGDWSLVEVGDVFTGDGVDTPAGRLLFSGNYSKIGRIPGDSTDIQTATVPVASDMGTITKLDRTNRLVSGTFAYDAVDITDDTVVFEVRDGVFTDLRY